MYDGRCQAIKETIMKTSKGKVTDIPLTDNDYTLVDEAAWFTVKKFSIRIHATDEGVIADIFALGREMDESIASTYAYDSECEES
jgi:hypothetical protein